MPTTVREPTTHNGVGISRRRDGDTGAPSDQADLGDRARVEPPIAVGKPVRTQATERACIASQCYLQPVPATALSGEERVSTHSDTEWTTPFLPEVEIDGPSAQRRWTVFLRLILLIPHFVVLYFVGIAAAVVAVIGWVATLILGWLPDWIEDFLALYVGYETRIAAALLLLVDRYPPFLVADPRYPVRIDVRLRAQNRLAVLFRLILAIPAAIVASVLAYGWVVLAFFVWLVVLVAGRTPRPVFDANAAVLRYSYRLRAYVYLLTSSYPKRLFGDHAKPASEEPQGGSGSPTRPLVLSHGGRILLTAYIVIGVIAIIVDLVMSATAPPRHYQPYETTMPVTIRHLRP